VNTILIYSALFLAACAVYGMVFQIALAIAKWMLNVRNEYHQDYNLAACAAAFWPLTAPLVLPILLIGYSIAGGNAAAKWLGHSIHNLFATYAARKHEKPDVKDEDEL
jgi:TRAP-type C4-dicarboxylate transport system permease large subunit